MCMTHCVIKVKCGTFIHQQVHSRTSEPAPGRSECAQYGADLPTPTTMNVTKVNYGSIEGLPMMHVHDAMLI